MTITVSSGVTSSYLTISSGDPLVVQSGGLAKAIIILSGGAASLSAGGIVSSVAVSAGGVIQGAGFLEGQSDGNGLLSGLTLVSGAGLFLDSGGTGSGLKATQSSEIVILDGAVATGTVLSAAQLEVSGTALSTVVQDGGLEEVFGKASGDTVESGGSLILFSGGSLNGETVQSGGIFQFSGDLTSNLDAGETSSSMNFAGVTLAGGATLEFGDITVRSGAIVSMGGTSADQVVVDAGGVLIGPGAIGSSGAVVAGALDGVAITSEGHVELADGATASGVSISNAFLPTFVWGGLEIDSGATATGTLVGAFSKETVRARGVASATTVLMSGHEYVLASASAWTRSSAAVAWSSCPPAVRPARPRH